MRGSAYFSPLALFLALTLTGCRDPEPFAVPLDSRDSAPTLLFVGTGASNHDVNAIKAILNGNQLPYSIANSPQLDSMSEMRLRAFQLLIVPGGNFVDIGNGLKPVTSVKIRVAVQSGLSYLGICAGAFLGGYCIYNGFNLTSGVKFHFYSAEGRGIRKAVVPISSIGAPTLDQYWEDGPEFTGWGLVVGKYPDGSPAIVEGKSGEGWVILSGIHSEAPASWRHGMDFTTPVSVDHAYTAMLIRAGLKRTLLPHY